MKSSFRPHTDKFSPRGRASRVYNRPMRILVVLILLLGLGGGAAWYFAGRAAGPTIEIAQPAKAVGQIGDLVVNVDTPGGQLVRLDISLEQNGRLSSLFSMSDGEAAQLTRESDDRIRVTRAIGKRQIPELETGNARIVVTAVRPVLFGYREIQSTAARDVEVRLTPPQIAVQSTHHYINHGGSEMVVYRVRPADAVSGVRVGNHEYLGFPASGAGIENGDPALRVAFFALLWDQDRATPIDIFARDEIGNESHATFDYRVFPKAFRKSRIQIDDRFLSKVVPAILQSTPELRVENPADLLASFLRINRDLRRENNATIAALARQTAPEILWQGPFKQLLNSAVEAGFADQRTYIYKGQDVDQQVHLGFDLASTTAAPVRAANRGKVLYAGWLGIYGNCVILDHGMRLQSLYAHLSSIDVKVGDLVDPDEQLGRSGSTGMAAGDHLHFTLLLAGNAITPIDWWSPKWVNDRIVRKLREADTPAAEATSVRR
jgi:murein DD-endopeptidase MepM/ murein hydrolase activator NlpD